MVDAWLCLWTSDSLIEQNCSYIVSRITMSTTLPSLHFIPNPILGTYRMVYYIIYLIYAVMHYASMQHRLPSASRDNFCLRSLFSSGDSIFHTTFHAPASNWITLPSNVCLIYHFHNFFAALHILWKKYSNLLP